MTGRARTLSKFGRVRFNLAGLAPVLFGAILAAPSIWFLATVAPLWRDLDGYVQLTEKPGITTILGHAPLYCFAARVPLLIGYWIEYMRGSAAALTANFFFAPQLTDSGVFLLIVSQHAALIAGAVYLLTGISREWRVRLVLAAVWGAIPLFPTFAHCVGSETLSMLCILFLAGAGLRIVRAGPEARAGAWLLFGGLLSLSILTRHVNHLLAVLLPGTFLLGALRSSLWRLAPSRAAGMSGARSGTREQWWLTAISLAVAVAAILVANLAARAAADAANVRFRSRIGFTFLWRLQFLDRLEPTEQDQLLARVSARTSSVDAQRLVSLLGEELRADGPLSAGAFAMKTRAALYPPPARNAAYRTDLALNAMTWAFLKPPEPRYLHAVATDVARSLRTTLSEVTDSLFATTAYFFHFPEQMPQNAGLRTFRGQSADAIIAIPTMHRYLKLGRGAAYYLVLAVWAAALAVLWARGRRHGAIASATRSYTIALTLTGLLMMLSTCAFGEMLPRYTLPMWECLLVGLLIATGEIFTNPLIVSNSV